jgi:NADPH-dependent 2,4-dienoyl-CoA reductase/sulfur reductase-like enzyme
MRLVVVGGSDAGVSAGLRARELDPSVEVTLLVADAYPQLLHLRAALLPVRRCS